MSCPDCIQVAPGHVQCRAGCYTKAMTEAAEPYNRVQAIRQAKQRPADDWLNIKE